MSDVPDSHLPPTIDAIAARRWQQRPQKAAPWLHEEVAKRMDERLSFILRKPQSWLHWEPVRGGLIAQQLLQQRYPRARAYVHAELPSERVQTASWWRRLLGSSQEVAPPVELLWANMSLHMQADPQALVRQWHEALAVDGMLMFSCLGPDTLHELRTLYADLGWPPPAHEFTDMHDWGDMLVAAGFAEPVMDMERIELTFATPERLLQELRELGRNLHPQRWGAQTGGSKGRGWLDRLHAALCKLADPEHDGRLKLTFEIIYGHALRPARRLAVQAETRLSVDELREQLRGRPHRQ